jgi:hypothetical protein
LIGFGGFSLFIFLPISKGKPLKNIGGLTVICLPQQKTAIVINFQPIIIIKNIHITHQRTTKPA